MLAALLLAGVLVTPSGTIYDAHGRRQGYVKESRPGQFDLYDAHSRRLGYGRRNADGRIEFFDSHSRRLLEIRPDRVRPRRWRAAIAGKMLTAIGWFGDQFPEVERRFSKYLHVT